LTYKRDIMERKSWSQDGKRQLSEVLRQVLEGIIPNPKGKLLPNFKAPIGVKDEDEDYVSSSP